MVLQMGIPGGPELLIILLISLLLFGIPLVLVGAGAFLWIRSRGSDGSEERIERLEAEVEQLRAQTGEDTAEADEAPSTAADQGTENR